MEGIYVKEILIENFKCFKGRFKLAFNKGLNIIVGDNESGKSTILDAFHVALTGLFHGKYLKNELTQYLFNNAVVTEFLEKINNKETKDEALLPHILIEVYFSNDQFPSFEGDGNSSRTKASGISYKIAFNDAYKSEYENLVKSGDLKTLPIEYYEVYWSSFARESITARSIPIKSALIDSTAYRYQNGSDIYISRIIKDLLDIDDQVNIAQAHRKMKDQFMSNGSIANINAKIQKAASISNKEVKLSVELSSKNAWENSLMTYLDEVPFHHVGKGEQCVVKTKLALGHKKSQEANILLIEEPENHLSHARLNQLINEISRDSEKQIIISTHSSFVANKLGLGNLILLHEQKNFSLNDLTDETKDFFKKLSGYDTLRLLLCKKAILVEGDSDELIVQKAYMSTYQNKLPIHDGIDVISVGTAFRRFLEIAEQVKKEVVVVTDNDSDLEAVRKKYSDYLGENKRNHIKICFDDVVDGGTFKIKDKPFNYNTLEPKLVKANDNDLSVFNRIFDREFSNVDDLHRYMHGDKTNCALKIFDSSEKINFPQYILDAIDDEQG
ncbi:ATP-dependent nuclease [Legionella pneumophila]|uniref:ATP-dependent nuclease n=1 Tax=Legionella pneumophila TaxID=446 RepID=UPI001C1DAE7D|nr:AAA family ATPase [Legionella pneumophila]HBD9273250.1 AAA family ATPase [Legionella pneumophila]HBD9315075.1 AAA family ATPase [Legionella pneumophila]HBD9424265.1 AAA family ATPase [Legionella pneumophila]HCJ1145453.1 AAA family ATPase [Legionella pneumophila]